MERRAFVYEAELTLAPDVDTRAPGGAVTVELCGHWEHADPCRWPHNSEIDVSRRPARFRTVFACAGDEEADVRGRIDRALRDAGGWTVESSAAREPNASERELADRLRDG